MEGLEVAVYRVWFVAVAPLALIACAQHDRSPVASPPPPQQATAPASPAAPGSGYDVRRPCSMITAAEVSEILQFPVTANDEQYRCKFVDAKNGWLSLELMEASSRGAKETCEYAPDKRTAVPGVGDSASYFGATVCVKLGDVAIIVDGANLAEHSDALRGSGADKPEVRVAKLVSSRIP
jgi:hypothetical protein